MEHLPDDLAHTSRHVRLRSGAKSRIRERLMQYLQEHPVPVQPVLSPYQRFVDRISPFNSRFNSRFFVPAAGAFVLLLTFGGVSTYAAEGALPGTILYPIKVSVIEPVREFLATSPEAKAKRKVAVAETRLGEVAQLAVEKEVTPAEGIRNQERFDRALAEAEVTIEKLSRDNPAASAEIGASLDATLKVHDTVFSTLASTTAFVVDATSTRSFSRHLKREIESRRERKSAKREAAASTTPARNTSDDNPNDAAASTTLQEVLDL